MRDIRKCRRSFLGVIGVVAGLSLLSTAASAQVIDLRAKPRVAAPNSSPFGLSYGDWSAAWWQWASALPVPGHPLFDETGAQCGAGNSGPVWFLGGVINETGSAVRNCALPSGTTVFFPILNVECSNVEGNGVNAVELRACAVSFMELATDMVAEIDGERIPHLQRFRVQSGTFPFALPDDNFFQFFGVTAATPGTCFFPAEGGNCEPYLSFGDGVYLMAGPLSDGQHTIHIHGTFSGIFTLDVVYHLTVGID